jgi:hypothetical protein
VNKDRPDWKDWRLRLDIDSFKYMEVERYIMNLQGRVSNPPCYGNGLVRQNIEAKNERIRAGLKPAPTEKFLNFKAGLESPAYRCTLVKNGE